MSLAMLENECMKIAIDFKVEINTCILYIKEYMITSIKEMVIFDGKESNGSYSIVRNLWSYVVNIRDYATAIKNTVASLWVCMYIYICIYIYVYMYVPNLWEHSR